MLAFVFGYTPFNHWLRHRRKRIDFIFSLFYVGVFVVDGIVDQQTFQKNTFYRIWNLY